MIRAPRPDELESIAEFVAVCPIEAMRLTVSSQNAAALALYEQLGFRIASGAVGYRRPAS